MMLAIVFAGLMLALTALDSAHWPDAQRTLGSDVRRALSSPRARAFGLTAIALAAVFILVVRDTLDRVTPATAFRRDVTRWYANRTADASTASNELGSSSGLRVVAFVTYRWSFRRASVLERAELVNHYRQLGLPVEFELHDFPMDAACNPAATADGAQAECEAAAAVRYMRVTQGNAAGDAMAGWLLRRATVQSKDLIWDRLRQLNAAAGLTERRNEMLDLVKKDVTLAQRLGVKSAPSYFVNGLSIPPGEEAFHAVLAYEWRRWQTRSAGHN
jgi:hypothetical protein